MGRRAVLLAVLAAALAWPASALAASGSLVNGVMNYTAGAGETNRVVFTRVDDPNNFEPTFQVVDDPAVSIAAQSPCNNGASPNIMECPVDGNGSGAITILTASLGDGADTITLLADLPTSIGAGGGADVMTGGPAADFLRGGQESDRIVGGGGNDQIVGDDPNVVGGGDDALDGGAGNDSVDGQDGNDTISSAVSDGADDYTGGGGTDAITFTGRAAPVVVSLDDQPGDGQAGEGDNVRADVENVTGGSAGDTLTGSAAANVLDGGDGGDVLNGAAGDDAVAGGGGNDDGRGGDGADLVTGGDGDDFLFGDQGADQLVGDTGADALQGGDADDSLQGGAGDDALDGSAGADVMAGGDGVDLGNYGDRTQALTITIDGNANDGVDGEGDNVQMDIENLRGGTGADTFVGSPGNNAFDSGAGEDYQDGGGGADALTGGDAGDVLRSRGGTGPAAISCGPGPDFVIAKATDTITPDCDRVDRGVNQRPKLRDSAVVAPAGGSLQMSPAGIVRRVPLQDRVVLPLRSLVDTVAGAVKVTSAATARKRQTMALEDGLFAVTQTAARRAVTQFALQGGDFSVCPAASRRSAARSAAKKSKTVRILWAKGKGRFRTKGRYAAATVRGTRWQTVDRCDGTLIRVARGSVSVRDLVRKRTVVVKAGDSYLASAVRTARKRR